jgi:hypothetical protein
MNWYGEPSLSTLHDLNALNRLPRTPYASNPVFEKASSRQLVNKPAADAPGLPGWHHEQGFILRKIIPCSRPQTVSIAAFILAVFSLVNHVSPLLPSEGVPEFVIYLGIVFGIVGLAAAAGLWVLKEWSIWLTIIVSVINNLSAAPGIAFASNAALQVAATMAIVGSAIIIVLVVLPSSRHAFVAS